jgi:macrolide transport system ATP-binding/permease protein
MIPEFLRRLAYYFHRRQFEEELDEEIRHHRALAGAKQFGNATDWKEESRAMWNWTFLEQLVQDLRYALRAMGNSRAFTMLAVLSLALGIGANTAIFSFMDAILWRSLPVSDPGSLVVLNWRAKAFGRPGTKEPAASVVRGMAGLINDDPRGGVIGGIFPYPAFALLEKNAAVFSALFGYCPSPQLNVKVRGEADLASGEYVSGDYFRALGVPPAAGRLITNDDDRAGAPLVAVMSFAYSQKRFGDPAKAVGSVISLNDVSFTVAGVAAPEFFGVDPANSPDVYLPVHADLQRDNYRIFSGSSTPKFLDEHFYWFQMMARLRPGVTRNQAQATVAPIFQEWVGPTAANSGERANLPELVLLPGGTGVDSLRLRYSKPLFLLLALVGLILTIACVNTANLLLARATMRRREMAVRLSLGAGRLRVIRQLLTESIMLASLGGALGIAFAVWGIRSLSLLLANGREHFTLRAGLNGHVLAVAVGLSVLTGVLFGLAPAIQATRVDVLPGLKNQRKHSTRRGVRLRFLIASQIAIALLVLVAAGLFTKTLANLNAIRLGFQRENLLLFQVDARQAGRRDPEIAGFYRNLQMQFEAIPGVRNVTLSNLSLMSGGVIFFPLKVRGKRTDVQLVLDVGPSFFTTMGIPILLGHEIEDRGRAAAVVDEEFAKTYFPDENPVGQHIALSGPDANHDDDAEIVGVSAKAKYGDLRKQKFFGGVHEPPVVYFLYTHVSRPPLGPMVFELRTAGNPLTYANTVREIVRKADAGVPVSDIKTQAAEIDERVNQEKIFARLSELFAMLALAITCVGLYGTVSYNVARRTNEIGIRVALGAQPTRVIGMILRDVLATVLAGLAIGVPAALMASKLVDSFLYGMKPNDPWALVWAVAMLLAAAFLAGYAPARRASRLDPVAALRNE